MSTERQLQGDSLRRQLQASADYAAANELTIDTTFKLEDIGLSGFSGANIEKGTLGKFIAAVKKGQIEKGSTLLVESLDRLSRQKVDIALRLFLDLLHHGIHIVTLMDGRHYTPDKIDNIELISSILIMSRANEESVTKSTRIAAAWKKNRANIKSRNLTTVCPGWLKSKPDNKGFDLIKDRVKIIERIFTEAADHGMGDDLIARRLNEEHVPTFTERAKGWHKSYIQKIITQRTVLGELQPHVKKDGKRIPEGNIVPDYYPRIISEDLFYRAQAAREQRRVGGGGRKGDSIANLFSGLLKCGTCNGPMVYLNRGMHERMKRDGRYLMCSNARRRITNCSHVSWRYDEFETSFLTFIKEIDLAAIVMKDDNETVRLADAVRAKEGELVEAKAKLEQAFELIGPNSTDFLKRKINDLDANVGKLESELESMRNNYDAITSRSRTFEEGKSGLSELVRKFQGGNEAYELRSTLAFHLKSIIETIKLFPDGSDKLFPPPYETKVRRHFIVIFKDGNFRLVIPTANDPTKLGFAMDVKELLSQEEG
jgi:DNA invertase Pin-like site-specific DNA recombinase